MGRLAGLRLDRIAPGRRVQSLAMTHEPAVLVKESCPDCGGEGEAKVAKRAGHTSWSKRVSCPTCDGKGERSRWVPLAELGRLLDDARTPGER